jgi:hypothetical protein
MPCRVTLAAVGLFLVAAPGAGADEPKKAEAKKKFNDKAKEIAGAAEFLRSVPKHFALLKAVDSARHRVTLLVEGDTLPKVWPLAPDAEVKVAGWWGRLDQLRTGDRVWVWFHADRAKQPAAVAMLADELSEQDIHGPGVAVEKCDAGSITLKPVKGKSRTLSLAKAELRRGGAAAPPTTLKAAERVYVQSTADGARLILDPAAFEARRTEQRAALRGRWLKEGLPGAVTFAHPFGGELDYVLDHEAMRWGRALKVGDKVTLRADPPIPALVKHVQPWRERTQLRLVVNGFDQADLTPGRRVRLLTPPPPPDVEAGPLPPDLDRPRTKAERVEWFLASVYCTCKVAGDVCTGHFYTLASCNVNGCGMPGLMRGLIADRIDKGLTDRQIFEQLLADHGPELLRPHLLP